MSEDNRRVIRLEVRSGTPIDRAYRKGFEDGKAASDPDSLWPDSPIAKAMVKQIEVLKQELAEAREQIARHEREQDGEVEDLWDDEPDHAEDDEGDDDEIEEERPRPRGMRRREGQGPVMDLEVSIDRQGRLSVTGDATPSQRTLVRNALRAQAQIIRNRENARRRRDTPARSRSRHRRRP